MHKLKRSECAVLPLVLKGEWYDMIASASKREEYRDASAYWERRIPAWWDSWGRRDARPRVVEFRHGYARDARRMAFVVYDVEERKWALHPHWGEPESQWHFVLHLGRRVELGESPPDRILPSLGKSSEKLPNIGRKDS